MVGDPLLCPALTAESVASLGLALSGPDKNDDRQEQQDSGPCQGAGEGHWLSRFSGSSTGPSGRDPSDPRSIAQTSYPWASYPWGWA